MLDLQSLNDAGEDDFVSLAGFLVENADWVVRSAAADRPFVSVDALCAALEKVIRKSPEDTLVALFKAHPELAGAEAQQGRMTRDSTGEQARLGLLELSPDNLARLVRLNASYHDRFSFPCIIALRRHADLGSIFSAFEQRLGNDRATEIANNVEEIMHVVGGRAERLDQSDLTVGS